MIQIELKFHDYQYLPYELRLAELEVERLLGAEPVRTGGSLHVSTEKNVDPQALDRLTYFQCAIVEGKPELFPQQARLEASATKHGDPRQLRRQSTRYSAHGLHEYRGKFNPQMVRTVTNILGLRKGGRVWDPFCGSGTVLLEARHQGFDALGVDLNPLAVTIANAKLSAVESCPDTLNSVACTLEQLVKSRSLWAAKEMLNEETISENLGKNWIERLPCPEYLTSWFSLTVLAQLLTILESVDEVAPLYLRDVFRMVLSSVVRDVSWQDPRDLRIRRRKNPAPIYPVVEVFVTALRSTVRSILAAQKHLSSFQGWQTAFLGDSGDPNSLSETAHTFLEDGVDCVIGSPPYATALPYIDTQRLSIALFGLASVREIRRLDASLIGSREISTRNRRAVEKSIEDNVDDVAEEVWSLCQELKDAYDPSSDGFRRQNTPAVVYRYFSGMTRAMEMAKRYLNKGGWLAFVLGPNRTSLGGREFLIDTPALLAATGSHVGLEYVDMHELDAYSRYDVHSRNSIREEQLLIMQRPRG